MPTSKHNPFNEDDRRFMALACTAALKGLGRVEPNPMVGCVIVKNGKLIATGWHRKFGGPHAEVNAIKQAGSKAAGATVYVTLEPCCHVGKTGPCSEALIEAKVARVVVGCRDPFPRVAGGGFKALRQNGIQTDVGLLEEVATEIIAPFRTLVEKRRPYVIAKWAQSLDGKIATASGDSKWISGEKARRIVHQLRGRMDAIVVGSRTVRLDDPMLTARGVRPRRIATRVVFDSGLNISPKSKLVQTAGEFPTVIMTTSQATRANSKRCEALKRKGVQIVTCRTRTGKVSPESALSHLAKCGMTNVLLEGGGALIGAFFDRGLVDESHVFTAPIVLGGDGPSGCDGAGHCYVREAVRGTVIKHRFMDGDQYSVVRFTNPKS
ncbi:MAG TPA: bifunctional diaminohydroxyphosphoribosylaminopyrimidine deaminase/5-amino-6-(5-phosphoribosylamino)uracil reductase RibD [Phycisphaerae bacterium]|nr:bifunctional diaminohydroxyphosphoribosylaminopyrimidine deaminase/5-amino-6-(5-phosphoribosylamino)uracil reductase RibD [Phycisphaerae bacterium]